MMSAFSNCAGFKFTCSLYKSTVCCWESCRLSSRLSYKETIFLPRTDFPHRVNAAKRVERDREIEKKAKFDELYKWQLNHSRGSKFVLHDGPPYANGDVHIGHAVNKILKDITLRSKLLRGALVNFIPGWDCHGLPIELKVIKDNEALSTNAGKAEVCKKAYEFAERARNVQLASFRKWGLVADWESCYRTFTPEYITTQLQLFHTLYEKNLAYQDYKPVFWSPYNRTSLAEAELEYNPDHISPSVYVKFPVVKCPDHFKSSLSPSSQLYAVVWTTTPWSIPANQGICYAANKRYCILKSDKGKEFYIICSDLVENFKDILKKDLPIVQEFDGHALAEFVYAHPLLDRREFPFLQGSHVTVAKGTGLVHMAPNHGLEDYAAAQEHHIRISSCIVDERGHFTSEAGSLLAGKDVLSSGTEEVIKLLKDYILHHHSFKHSYPYDWRSNRPVIIRSSRQWFIDVQTLKDEAKECLSAVEVIPASLKQQFLTQLEKSPQWCISRQRAWGVPIPVFYHNKTNTPLIKKPIVDHLCNLVREKGIHFWWDLPECEMLPCELQQSCGLLCSDYVKGQDIFDIWFDSGISWNVLPDFKVADVCIEGVDQIRGWFHSSLLTSVSARNISPYRRLFLHGFTTDADGKKMSKSVGNVTSPSDITDGVQSKERKLPALGIDVLRWWVAGHACQHENIPVKPNILEECSQNISKVRNVLRFLLGSLCDFDFAREKVTHDVMRPLDQYMLHLLKCFSDKTKKDYDIMNYKNIVRDTVSFVTNEVSAFYCQLIKDRLYCDSKCSLSRRSCLTTIYVLFDELIQALAPITPHLAEEAYGYHPDSTKAEIGVFRRNWEQESNLLSSSSFPEAVLWALQVRSSILKTEKKLISSEIMISGSSKVLHHLMTLQEEKEASQGNLCELFQVSKVFLDKSGDVSSSDDKEVIHGLIDSTLSGNSLEHFAVVIHQSPLEICPRCRRWASSIKSSLCSRCENVIKEQSRT